MASGWYPQDNACTTVTAKKISIELTKLVYLPALMSPSRMKESAELIIYYYSFLTLTVANCCCPLPTVGYFGSD